MRVRRYASRSHARSRCWFREVNAFPGICFANWAIRCRRVDTIPESEVSVMFSSNGLITRRPASLPRVLVGASSPASAVLSGRYDFLPSIPPHFVSFAWRYHSCICLRSVRSRMLEPPAWGRFARRVATPIMTWYAVEPTGPPKFPRDPHCLFAHAPATPAEPPTTRHHVAATRPPVRVR